MQVCEKVSTKPLNCATTCYLSHVLGSFEFSALTITKSTSFSCKVKSMRVKLKAVNWRFQSSISPTFKQTNSKFKKCKPNTRLPATIDQPIGCTAKKIISGFDANKPLFTKHHTPRPATAPTKPDATNAVVCSLTPSSIAWSRSNANSFAVIMICLVDIVEVEIFMNRWNVKLLRE